MSKFWEKTNTIPRKIKWKHKIDRPGIEKEFKDEKSSPHFHNSQTISQKIHQRNHFYLYFAGCLNAAFQVFLGCQAGYTILTYQGHLPRLLRFLAWGLVTGGMALLLCQASLNDGWVPINKNLWSASYALATTSLVI